MKYKKKIKSKGGEKTTKKKNKKNNEVYKNIERAKREN